MLILSVDMFVEVLQSAAAAVVHLSVGSVLFAHFTFQQEIYQPLVGC